MITPSVRAFPTTFKLPPDRRFNEDVREKAARVMMGLFAAAEGTHLSVRNEEYCTYLKIPGSRIELPLGLMAALGPLLRDIRPRRIKYKKAVEEVR